MRRTKQCPKCGGGHILVVPGWMGSHKSGQYMRLPGFHLFSANVKVDRYVCAGCGFIEEWVQNPKDMARMIKKAESA